MKQSSDESQIRELMQRLKRADEQTVPAFDDLLQRPVQRSYRRPARRRQLAIMCGCVAAAVSVAFLWTRSLQDDPVVEPGPRIAKNVLPPLPVIPDPNQHVVDIDFEDLHRAVEQHFSAAQMDSGNPVPDWASRTESLLALNLDISLQE